MAKIKKAAKKDWDYENVAVPKALIIKIRDYKTKNGSSIVFFVSRSIEKEFERLEAEKNEGGG